MKIETKVQKGKKEKILKTKKNKLRRINKELKKNPNNTMARKSLEFWNKV